jgi:hypothetical protein
MAHENDQIKQLGWELGQAIQTTLAASFDRNFADVVHDYRQIEADFVHRPGGNEFHVLETKRRIAEAILLATHSHRQPFDVCRNAWNDLLHLGFTNLRTKCTESWFYADCCLFNEQFDAGLAVLEPLMIEVRQQIDDPAGSWRQYYQDELVRLEKLHTQLQAGVRE